MRLFTLFEIDSALYELHNEVRNASELSDLVDRDHVGVGECRDRRSFPGEATKSYARMSA